MGKTVLLTDFAPAERDEIELVKIKAAQLLRHPLIEKLTNAVPETFLILNDKRQIVFVNKSIMKILGVDDPQALYGLRSGEAFDCIHSKETPGGCGTTKYCEFCGSVKAILNSQKGNSDVQECRIIQQKGCALDLRVWCLPLSIEGEDHSVFVAQDISDEKRRHILEKTFFHDIINTAGGIQGIIKIIKHSSQKDLDRYVDMLGTSIETLMEEVYAQKDLLAAENNKLEISKSKFNSISVLKETHTIYHQHEVGINKKFIISEDSCDIDVFSDRILLKRVLSNMAKNALEATHTGGTVTLGCRKQANDYVEFWTHNSRYMPPEVQYQIFQRSFSTKGAGRGIGAWSIKLLTEQYLDGKALFTTSEEDGTVFKALIPVGSEKEVDIFRKMENQDAT